MGVKGLWTLLNPVARPIKCVPFLPRRARAGPARPPSPPSSRSVRPCDVADPDASLCRPCRIETLEGKKLAIDSSCASLCCSRPVRARLTDGPCFSQHLAVSSASSLLRALSVEPLAPPADPFYPPAPVPSDDEGQGGPDARQRARSGLPPAHQQAAVPRHQARVRVRRRRSGPQAQHHRQSATTPSPASSWSTDGPPRLGVPLQNERKLRKAGNAVNHAQTAEKILNLQLRQAALKQAQAWVASPDC